MGAFCNKIKSDNVMSNLLPANVSKKNESIIVLSEFYFLMLLKSESKKFKALST